MKVKVKEGYEVPARFIDLEEGEELCETCKGIGEVVVGYTRIGPHIMGTCQDCSGTGKMHRCKECGVYQSGGIIKHKDADWMDGMCLECIRKELELI